MNLDHNKIVDQLYKIQDPLSGGDLIKSGRVRDLKIEDDRVYFELSVTGLDTGTRAQLNFSCQEKIKEVYPEAQIHIHMLTDKESGKEIRSLPQVKNIVAVASGKGGVGKSTITANLARAMRRLGLRVGVLDADLYGPSMPTIFDMEGERPGMVNVHGKMKLEPLQTAEGIHLISIGFIIEPQQAVVMRGPRLGGVLKQFINDCVWPELDVLLIDLPPGTGDIQLTLVQSVAVTGALIVTTPQKLSYIDALKATNMFLLDNIKVPILGIVENMAWFTPAELPGNKYFIFGAGGADRLAKESGAEVLGQIPLMIGLREASDNYKHGENEKLIENAYFDELSDILIKKLADRNSSQAATKKVEVSG